MTTLQRELVKAVKEHALNNYETGGWDYIVECYEDKDIVQDIGAAQTVAEAIRNVGIMVGSLARARAEVMAEVF